MIQVSVQDGISTSKRKETPPALSPNTVKKRRVLEERSQNIKNPLPSRGTKLSSQNVKSSFEEDLDRLTQEIGQVGDSISFLAWTDVAPFETDQKWTRPAVKPFSPDDDALSSPLVTRLIVAFQQIESEEAMDNGTPSIRLFGVTDVLSLQAN
jgi:hypothetical protein